MCDKDDIVGGDAVANAKITRDILEGVDMGPKRDIVILNSAAGIYISRDDITMEEAIKLAKESIDSKKALASLEKYIEVSNTFNS